jgi:hypothetical protein
MNDYRCCLVACLLGVSVFTGCLTDPDDTEEISQEIINCLPSDPDYPNCAPYPTPPPSTKRADLVPIFYLDAAGWCSTPVRVGVKNVGTQTAPASTMQLKFSVHYWQASHLAVPALAPGAKYEFFAFADYDNICFYEGGCLARVVVDSGSTVVESKELNNVTADVPCYYN